MSAINPKGYYGSAASPSISQDGTDNSGYNKCVAIGTIILSILSLIILILLNGTNLVLVIKNEEKLNHNFDQLNQLGSHSEQLSVDLQTNIKPKIDLINNAVTYQLPSSLSQLMQYVRTDLTRICSLEGKNFSCPQCPTGDYSNSNLFRPYSSGTFDSCIRSGNNLVVQFPIAFKDTVSFIPAQTKFNTCIRSPSFDIGQNMYVYTHNMVDEGCENELTSTQVWVMGTISDDADGMPKFTNKLIWHLNDKLNRKSCSVAVIGYGSWMLCSLMDTTMADDVQSVGINRLFLGYMDPYGRKLSWIYETSEISFDYKYNCLYPSVGAGIVSKGNVYFLVYGALTNNIDLPAMCNAPLCESPNQGVCNNAQKPSLFGNKQVVNGILSFSNIISWKPALTVKTIKPSNNRFGAEGRLYKDYYTGNTLIYIRSSSWYPQPQVGLINLASATVTKWIDIVTIARPGANPCGFYNKCPAECVTGVYTDLFPLTSEFQYAATVYLRSVNTFVDPHAAIINTTTNLYWKRVTTIDQQSGMTTTTCFAFSGKNWCVSIVEMTPGTLGGSQPIMIMYKLPLECVSRSTRGVDTGSLDQTMTFSLQDDMLPEPYSSAVSGHYWQHSNLCQSLQPGFNYVSYLNYTMNIYCAHYHCEMIGDNIEIGGFPVEEQHSNQTGLSDHTDGGRKNGVENDDGATPSLAETYTVESLHERTTNMIQRATSTYDKVLLTDLISNIRSPTTSPETSAITKDYIEDLTTGRKQYQELTTDLDFLNTFTLGKSQTDIATKSVPYTDSYTTFTRIIGTDTSGTSNSGKGIQFRLVEYDLNSKGEFQKYLQENKDAILKLLTMPQGVVVLNVADKVLPVGMGQSITAKLGTNTKRQSGRYLYIKGKQYFLSSNGTVEIVKTSKHVIPSAIQRQLTLMKTVLGITHDSEEDQEYDYIQTDQD
ncbi:attachment glycoprotein [Wufeng Typhlomys cinereus jeilongvirus 1]|uniref:Attachment glycoprotein n=1 Tax=Wufeng Typhlomys cinereus jeilongvirus 1 TaxID=2928989 RepID=A0A8T9KLW2_9MONO|nr:attachment glycoprotein [Wufeng Typhlomys cinereus jeilongvirus 1]